MGKTIILGASGFVGKALLTRFEQHNLPYAAPTSQSLNLAATDCLSKIQDLVKDGDRIILLAAHTPEKGNPRDLTLVNLQMIRNLLAGMGTRNCEHFTYVSSDAVYPLSESVINELTPPCPATLYGHMHAMREQYVRDHFPPQNLFILRPCAIYGPGDTHNAYGISRFIRSARQQGEIILFGNGEEYRDHIHVDDVADILFAAQQQKTSGLLNAASGKSWRFSEIATLVQAAIGRPVSIIKKPRAMPIFHRHTDISTLRRTFPSLAPRAVDKAIGELMKEPAIS